MDFDKFKEKFATVAARFRARARKDGPVLTVGEKTAEQKKPEITLTTTIIDRGNIALVEIKGEMTNQNRHVISECLKNLEQILAKTVVIDINGVEKLDDFGYGTLAVINGWLALVEKESFLSCENSMMKARISALGISHLVPEYPASLEI